ncbi:ribonuclease H-like domain-containing protein [Tanacetum coccineum]
MEPPHKTVDGHHHQLIEDLEAAYDNAPNMFSILIHHGRKFQSYPGRMYVSGRVDIFDMVDIDLPLTSLDEGLYALACEEDVRCLATLVRSFKLIEVYIEHGVTALYSYLMAPRFRATLKEINDEPAGSIAANRTEKMLLLTWHESSETPKEHVCDSITPSSLPQPDCILTLPTDESVITYTQLDDVIMQLSFDETELDEEAGFVDVTGSGVDSSRLSHDESFGVDDLDLNLNEEPDVNLNVSQVETQSELPVSEEPDVGRSQEPILAEVSTQEPIVAEVSTEVPIVEEYNGEFNESARSDGQFFFDDEGIDTEYDVQSSEDAGTDDDDDVDEDFLVDEENEIVEPDVDVHLFGISVNLPFDNIGVTNLVSDDVLEREDVDVINPDGFDSDHGNDEQTNYRKRRLAELRTEMKGVINASGQWKYSFYTGQKFSTPKEAKDRVYLHSIESRRNLKLYKNDGVRIRARYDGKVSVFTMSQGDGPTGPNHRMEPGPSGSNGPTTRSKKRKNTGTNADSQASSSSLRQFKTSFNVSWRRDLLGLDGAFMKGPFPGQCLGDDIDLHPNSNITFISNRKKGIIPAIKTVYPSAEHRYCLRHIHENMKQGWCGQAYKDLLWRAASATNVRDFEKCMLELKTMNPKAHEWLNKIPAEHWARSYFSGRAKSDLLLNNICEVFNGKIVGGRDKPVITLLEYIREYCMKRIVNVQGVIDKCTGPLTPTATRIMESIKKEAHLMKVQWNGANKYQVSGSLGDQCVVDVVSMTCSCRKWELTGIPCKHVVAACWNMALNDRAAPPPETWEKSTCPTTLLPPNATGASCRSEPRKKRKRSKHEDEPFGERMGKLSRKGITITCQSCGNTRHNKATCKGQEPAVGQDGSGGSGVGAVIGLSTAAGEGGQGSVGVANQGSSHNRWTKSKVQTERMSLHKRTPTQPASQPSTSFQVPVSEIRNADGRERWCTNTIKCSRWCK